MDIHGYQPPWKALSEFALHQDLDRMDPNAPQFQHLVGQVSQDSRLLYHQLHEVVFKNCPDSCGNLSGNFLLGLSRFGT